MFGSSSNAGVGGSAMTTQRPHVPTVVTVLGLVLVLFLLYHLMAGRRR